MNKYKLVKCSNVVNYNSLNGLDFISNENDEIVEEFEISKNYRKQVEELKQKYNLVNYYALENIANDLRKKIEVNEYSIIISNTYNITYNIIGYEIK